MNFFLFSYNISSSPEREVSPDLLFKGAFNGDMVVAGVEATVLLFYVCFEFGAFVLVVMRSLQTTWPVAISSKPSNAKPKPTSIEINFGIQGEGWSWRGTLTLGIWFFSTTTSTASYAVARGGVWSIGSQGASPSLRPPLLKSWVIFLVFSCCDHNVKPPKAVESISALLPCWRSFRDKFFANKPFATSHMTQSFCAKKLANWVTIAKPSKLNDEERTKALLPLLGFRSSFHNKPLPWSSDACVSTLDTFHVLRSPFIHSLTWEEIAYRYCFSQLFRNWWMLHEFLHECASANFLDPISHQNMQKACRDGNREMIFKEMKKSMCLLI